MWTHKPYYQKQRLKYNEKISSQWEEGVKRTQTLLSETKIKIQWEDKFSMKRGSKKNTHVIVSETKIKIQWED